MKSVYHSCPACRHQNHIRKLKCGDCGYILRRRRPENTAVPNNIEVPVTSETSHHTLTIQELLDDVREAEMMQGYYEQVILRKWIAINEILTAKDKR